MDQLGSDMLVDQEYNETESATIISPDDSMEDAEPEPLLRADDYDAVKKRYLQELPGQETDSEGVHTWEITDWRGLTRREQGPIFKVGGHPWRILFFPFGNNVECASFYLEHGFEDKPPEDWYACVQFLLVLWNPNDPTMHVMHHATHRFTADEGDWGFTRFAELRKLFAGQWEDKGRPMVENDCANITAYVRVLKDPTGVLWHSFHNYDSKKETGMVGLKNQGTTCYLNSLLQSLYFTTAFRKAIYQIPTENDDLTNSAYALQRLFYQLQTSTTAVSTIELTKSFGWKEEDTIQILLDQQDVPETSRILRERMAEKMKGTEAEKDFEKMFVGKMKTYLSCINVDYESSLIEDFWDVHLNVAGMKNLDDSFKAYIQVETMEGENKYFAEGYGLQDAKKGIIFESFPQVLHIQLKRYDYDANREALMKVNDWYEFPEIWDASPYLSESADRSEPWIYHLHGVLVHSGDFNAGHYYAFLKPTKEGPFFKFDDELVVRATKREALEENFGGDYTNLPNGNAPQRNPYTRTLSSKRSMSAYMLVYIRESRLNSILLPDEEVVAPEHLVRRIAEERAAAEKRRKEREEAYLYMEIQVATEKNFSSYQGFDIVPWKGDLDDAAVPKTYRILRTMTIADFTMLVAEDLNVEPGMLRPWSMVNRQNGTVRPDQVIAYTNFSVEEAATKYGTKTANFRIFMEETSETDAEGNPVFGDAKLDLHGIANNRPLMLFLKHFDPEKQSLYGVSTFYAAWQDKVQDLSPQILKLLNWPAGTTIKLFEEIKHNMIEAMKPKVSLAGSELQDGDIITVQKALSEKEVASISANGRFTDVRDFYEYLLNKCDVTFSPRLLTENGEGTFTLTLSKKMSYDQFSAKVGEHLGVDPTHIRFSTINVNSGRPKATVKRTATLTLANILYPTSYGTYTGASAPKPDQLLYEVLEMSLQELEMRKSIKVIWLPEGISKEENYDILVAKNGNVSDLMIGLQRKLNLPDEVIQNCRVYEAHGNKFFKFLPEEHNILHINEFFVIYVEKIPDEELEVDDPRYISVFHFEKEPSKTHGVPFRFMLKEGELFKDTKERLSKRTGIKGKQFEKIKFALIQKLAYPKPEYLNDDDCITDLIGSSEGTSLGMDHVNKNRNYWGKANQIFIR